jgi:hypothetical protein
MNGKIIENALKDLYSQSIDYMEAEKPTQLYGELEQIEKFGFESFTMGFLYGLNSRLTTESDLKVE